MPKPRITSLLEMLDALDQLAKKKKKVTLQDIMDSIGHRSFGPLLLLGGIILAAPGIGDIPGVPTVTGVFIVLVAGQLLLRRNYVWLPGWLLHREVATKSLRTMTKSVRKPAGHLDKVVKKRLVIFTNGFGAVAIGAICFLIGVTTPLTEVVLFAANIAGAAVAAFGLSLVVHDGWVAIIGFATTIGLIVLSVVFALS